MAKTTNVYFTLQVQGEIYEPWVTVQHSYRLDNPVSTFDQVRAAAVDFTHIRGFRLWKTSTTTVFNSKISFSSTQEVVLISEENWLDGEPG